MAPSTLTDRALEQPDHRRSLGGRGEALAARHLERQGFTVLDRNVRSRFGEIDLIASDRQTLVFAEVKTRRLPRSRPIADDAPLLWLGARQRVRLRHLAVAWLSDSRRERPRVGSIRFDALGVVLDEHGEVRLIEHLENAW